MFQCFNSCSCLLVAYNISRCSYLIQRCRCFHGSHYDTLKLSKDCSRKEIREAFLKLSKECHPDKNINNPKNHADFIKLNEAYNVLNKPSSRQNYDLMFSRSNSRNNLNRQFYDTTLRKYRDTSRDKYYQDKSYYGISGIKRKSNSHIVTICILFMLSGVILQGIAIRTSVSHQKTKIDEDSSKNSELLSVLHKQAIANGNKAQLDLLKHSLHTDNGKKS